MDALYNLYIKLPYIFISEHIFFIINSFFKILMFFALFYGNPAPNPRPIPPSSPSPLGPGTKALDLGLGPRVPMDPGPGTQGPQWTRRRRGPGPGAQWTRRRSPLSSPSPHSFIAYLIIYFKRDNRDIYSEITKLMSGPRAIWHIPPHRVRG